MKLYSYSACSTCRKALAWLQERGLGVELIDITQQPPTLAELTLALEQLGRKRLFNTSGQSYRALGSAAVAAMNDEQALAALAADGKLIKRPVLITADQQVLTGFKSDEWQALLG
ncbi:MAG: arsenate reductase family protein [Prochlorococcaceae cyanobacterium]